MTAMKKEDFNAIPENERAGRVLEGKAYYASVHRPNTSAQKKFNAAPFYVVNLALDKKEAKKAAEWGLSVKEPTEGIPEPHVVLKRKVRDEDNVDRFKPDVVDSMQNPVPSNIIVGNGSVVRCKFGTYWYENNGGGVGTALYKVQIRDLVPFEGSVGGDSDMVTDDSGFTVDGASSAEVAEEIPSDEIDFDEE